MNVWMDDEKAECSVGVLLAGLLAYEPMNDPS